MSSALEAPGAYRPPDDRWGRFEVLVREATPGAVFLVDAKVARLHPKLLSAVASTRPRAVLKLRASEELKSLASLGRLLEALAEVPRGALLVAVGGGTVGDVAAVAAHLARRGLELWQVPTTLLAAADSSLGGKGALNLGGVKNSAGVFHYPARVLLCPEWFATLSPARRREGALEALKLELCTSRRPSWSAGWREELEWVRRARRQKEARCAADPYEKNGVRAVLNFGHTFGHALEAVSGFRLSHGEAVGLGMLCALDVGRALGVTPAAVARAAEALLERVQGAGARARLSRWLDSSTPAQLRRLVGADKKAGPRGARMLLLHAPGDARLTAVGDPVGLLMKARAFSPRGAARG